MALPRLRFLCTWLLILANLAAALIQLTAKGCAHGLAAHAGINIVALHNHMIGEEPTLYFTHFWGKGPAADLAKAIKSALDAQKSADKATH